MTNKEQTTTNTEILAAPEGRRKTNNRRSFDCASRDETARGSAQDDSKNRQRQAQVQKRNAGILRCAQNDKQRTDNDKYRDSGCARMTISKGMRSDQDDDFKEIVQARMTISKWASLMAG
jgi:hypothetical protein